jgi:hypothetical protein
MTLLGARGSKPLDGLPGRAPAPGESRMIVPTTDSTYVLMYSSGSQNDVKGVSVLLPNGDTLLNIGFSSPERARSNIYNRNATLSMDRRAHLFVAYQLLVVIPAGDDRLVLRRIALQEALDRVSDRLLVVSPTALLASHNQPFSHKLRVRSKRGAVTYAVNRGPANMAVAADGTVTLPAPEKYAGKEVSAVIQVRDASGQEVFHSINILVR